MPRCRLGRFRVDGVVDDEPSRDLREPQGKPGPISLNILPKVKPLQEHIASCLLDFVRRQLVLAVEPASCGCVHDEGSPLLGAVELP